MRPGETLVGWFVREARRLPWREEPRDPYRTLVSETMLQQTQVERVVPRYREFLERFPSLEALAAAPEEAVLEAWSGLGYYRRALRLHQLAREVTATGVGLPRTAEELRSLPGIGPSTAAAVASLAFGERVAVLDGNVLRVASRVLGEVGDPRTSAARRRIAAWVRGLMDGGAPGVVNEALMELGAMVCRPRGPLCGRCPLAQGCRAAATGEPERYPPPRRGRAPVRVRWAAAVVVDGGGRWALRPVEGFGVLEGLWLPPIAVVGDGEAPEAAAAAVLGSGVGVGRVLAPVGHAITHRRIEVTPVVWRAVEVPGPEGVDWADPRRPGRATSSLLGKLVRRVEEG